MEQSSQMLNGGAPSVPVPLTNITTEQIQKYLDENRQLILTILEYQNQGKFTESASYQARLQQNLTYLAKLADAQQLPSMPPQMPPQSAVVQQHPPQAAVPQQQSATFTTRFPVQLNDDQQQQQQLMQTQMGMKPGALSCMHQSMQFGGGSKQDGIASGADAGAGDFPGNLASGYSRGDTEPYG